MLFDVELTIPKCVSKRGVCGWCPD